MPHVNNKPLARKRILVQTPFNHSSAKLEQKITPQNNLLLPTKTKLYLPKSSLRLYMKNHENVSKSSKDIAQIQFKPVEL